MSLKKNFIYNLVYQVFLIIIPLITAPYISRVIGAEGIGIYSYTNTIAYYFMLFAMLGVNNYGTRSIATVRDNRSKLSSTFWSIYLFQLFTTILMVICYIAYLVFISKQNFTISAIEIMIIISAAFDINWLLFGLEKFRFTTVRNIMIRIITLMLIFVFVKNSNDLWKYVFIMSFGIILSQLSIWPFISKYVDYKNVRLSEILHHATSNLVLFIPVVAVSLYKSMDKLMLGYISNMTQVGFFENTERIINIPMGIIVALGTVMLPRMSKLISQNNVKQSNILFVKSIWFTNFISAALTFGISGIAPIFAIVFFGKEFSECGILISAISPTIMVISWANILRTQYLIPNHKDREYIISVLLGAIVNLTVNLVLIPKYNALGAVIGTVSAETSVFLCQSIMVRKNMNFFKYLKNGVGFIPIGVVMFVVVRIIGQFGGISVSTLILQIICGGVIYLSLSLVYIMLKQKLKISDFKRILK